MADVVAPARVTAQPFQQRSELRRTVRVLTRNRLVLAGLIMVIGLIVVAALAGLIAPYDPIANNVRAALQPPSSYYYFGTDRFGRDVFSRVVHGSRLTLLVAIVSGESTFGKTCRNTTLGDEAPITRAASTYSLPRSTRTGPRMTRPKTGE